LALSKEWVEISAFEAAQDVFGLPFSLKSISKTRLDLYLLFFRMAEKAVWF